MKIVYRQPKDTADVSSARGATGKELWQLILYAAVLLIALFFAVGWSVDFMVAQISFKTEAKVFKPLQVIPKSKTKGVEPADLIKIEAILAKLQNNPKVPPLPYRLVVIEQAEPNAFAFPGGTIGVTEGLLEVLDDEIGLAFVLGHELGHFYNRDHLQGFGRAVSFRIIMAVIFDAGAESVGDMVELGFQRSYSQKAEKAADRFGLELVHAAYGETEGGDRLFQLLLEKRNMPEWAYMFATHPSPQNRIDDLKAYAERIEARSN